MTMASSKKNINLESTRKITLLSACKTLGLQAKKTDVTANVGCSNECRDCPI